MMLHLLDDLPEGIDSKYRLIHIVGKRAKQIHRGAHPLVNTRALKPTSIALEEVIARKVKIEAPPAEWEGSQGKQAAQEARAAWFRHIPPEELIPAHLVSGE
jgi:DNA-directed RNA polymerase omega subunit